MRRKLFCFFGKSQRPVTKGGVFSLSPQRGEGRGEGWEYLERRSYPTLSGRVPTGRICYSGAVSHSHPSPQPSPREGRGRTQRHSCRDRYHRFSTASEVLKLALLGVSLLAGCVRPDGAV